MAAVGLYAIISRSLAKAEAHYSQIEREALAIVFAVKRLHIYLFGRSFVLCSDHKPLLHIFGEKYGLSATAVSRLQRWAVILSEYDYVFEHISGSSNAVADCLSRLPMDLTAAQEVATVSAVNEHAHDPHISSSWMHTLSGSTHTSLDPLPLLSRRLTVW